MDTGGSAALAMLSSIRSDYGWRRHCRAIYTILLQYQTLGTTVVNGMRREKKLPTITTTIYTHETALAHRLPNNDVMLLSRTLPPPSRSPNPSRTYDPTQINAIWP